MNKSIETIKALAVEQEALRRAMSAPRQQGKTVAYQNLAALAANIDLSQVLKDLERYKAALELIADPNTKVTEVCEKFDKPVTSALDIWWSRHIAECALSGTTLPNEVTQGAQP